MPAVRRLTMICLIVSSVFLTAATASARQYEKQHCRSDAECVAAGERLMEQKKFHEAAEYFVTALDHLKGTRSLGKAVFITTKLGVAFFFNRDFANSQKAFNRVLKMCSGKPCGSKTIAYVQFKLADSFALSQNPEQAEQHYEQAVILTEADFGPNSKHLLEVYNSTAKNYLNLGKPDKAEAVLVKLVSLCEKIFGNESLETSRAYNNLASAYSSQFRKAKAVQFFIKTLDIEKKHYPNDPAKYQDTIFNLATEFTYLNKLKEAESMLLKLLSIAKMKGQTSSPHTAKILRLYANNLFKQQRYDEADNICDRARKIFVAAGMTNLADMGRIYQIMGNSLTARNRLSEAGEQYEKALDIFNKHYGKDSVASLELFIDLGKYHDKAGHLDKSKYYHIKAIETLLNFKNSYTETMASLLQNVANVCIKQRHPNEALKYYIIALKIQEKQTPASPEIAHTCEGIARLYSAAKQYDDAHQYLEKALQINIKAYGPLHTEVAKSHFSLAKLYKSTGKSDEAEKAYRKCIEIQTSVLGDTSPELGESYFHLGVFLFENDDFRASIESLKQALAIYQGSGMEQSGQGAGTNQYLGEAYLALGKTGPAKMYCRRALDTLDGLNGQFPLGRAQSHGTLGDINEKEGNYGKACEHFLAAAEIYQKTKGEEHALVGDMQIKAGINASFAGRFPEAEGYYQSALNILSKAHGPLHPKPSTVYLNMGALYVRWGQLKKAEGMYVVALTNFSTTLGENSPLTGQALWGLSDIIFRQGRAKDAKGLAIRSIEVFTRTYGSDHPQTDKAIELLRRINESLSQSAV